MPGGREYMSNELENNVRCFASSIKQGFCQMQCKGAPAFHVELDHCIEKHLYEVGPLEYVENLKNNFIELMRNATKPDGTKKTNFGWTIV